MTVTEIYYERVHNLGDYESERIGIRAVLDAGENEADAMEAAKQFVTQQFSPMNPEPTFQFIAEQEGA